MTINLIRFVLALLVLYFIYQETGPVTAVAFGMLFVLVEIAASWAQQVNMIFKTLHKIIGETPK
jgi:hypothetical protein